MRILGVDPGVRTGAAIFEDGSLSRVWTTEPLDVFDMIRQGKFDMVVCEDSRLLPHVWTAASQNKSVAVKIARDLGTVDQLCAFFNIAAIETMTAYLAISAREKGCKLNAEEFVEKTGWTRPCSQHARDAVMVAWNYRHTRKTDVSLTAALDERRNGVRGKT